MKYQKNPYVAPWINHRNEFFSKLFIRGLNCMNKVFLNGDFGLKNSLFLESFFSTFFPVFSFYLVFRWTYSDIKSEFLRQKSPFKKTLIMQL